MLGGLTREVDELKTAVHAGAGVCRGDTSKALTASHGQSDEAEAASRSRAYSGLFALLMLYETGPRDGDAIIGGLAPSPTQLEWIVKNADVELLQRVSNLCSHLPLWPGAVVHVRSLLLSHCNLALNLARMLDKLPRVDTKEDLTFADMRTVFATALSICEPKLTAGRKLVLDSAVIEQSLAEMSSYAVIGFVTSKSAITAQHKVYALLAANPNLLRQLRATTVSMLPVAAGSMRRRE